MLHHEGSWLQQVQTTLEWFQTTLRLAAHQEQGLADWTHAVEVAGQRPQYWRRMIKIAKRTALLKAQWEAERQQFYGLMPRTLKARGAVCPGLVEETAVTEVCALCGRVFRTLRDWSHHAFKVHGRVREERRLFEGTQCPVCLKHFVNTEKLCNHIRYSGRCKAARLAAEVAVQPGPGRGSRRFDDGSRSQLLAVQAEGPRGCWPDVQPVPEANRPSELVLLALEDCFSNDSVSCGTFEELQMSYRRAFSRECLQHTRLRATAEEWRRRLDVELHSDEEHKVQWASWHSAIARQLEHVQWDAWLVPQAPDSEVVASSFRDADVQLPWLSLDSIVVPEVPCPGTYGRCISALWHGPGDHRPFQKCWEDPSLVDPDAWIAASTGERLTVLSCVGLIRTVEVPVPIKSYLSFEKGLRCLRLYSDLVRGTLQLWLRGSPAVIIVQPLVCPAFSALKRLARHTAENTTFLALGNCPCEECLAYFTPLINA